MKEITIDKRKISMMINYIIFIMAMFGVFLIFSRMKISFYREPVLNNKGINAFKYFTVESNVLMGIIALVFAHKERKLINGKIKEIPIGYYIVKFMITVAVALTFIVVAFCVVYLMNGMFIGVVSKIWDLFSPMFAPEIWGA